MFRYFTIDSFDFKDKVVGVRVDINSPIINNKIVLNQRIIESAKTIKELIELGAKVVILAHQGRAGQSDCVSLKEHSKLLSKEVGKKIDFSNELSSDKVFKKILKLKSGSAILLENLRFNDDELYPEKKINSILKLEKFFDYYICDAFSVAHRKQTSTIGFKKIPNIAGRVMEKELSGLNQILEIKHPKVFILGGAKPDDLVELMEVALKNNTVDLILLTGVIGEIAISLKGFDLGKKLKFLIEHNYLDSITKIKELLNKYSSKIIFPEDIALIGPNKKRIEIKTKDFNLEKNKLLLDKYLIEDIGSGTIKTYSSFLNHVSSIYLKGPAGNFEKKDCSYGTSALLEKIVKSKAFIFMGGGHSVTSASMFKVLDKFSYVSLAGGALVKFLSGKELPAVSVLESSFLKYAHKNQEFIVVGSNTVDSYLTVDEYFSNIQLGDKIKIKENFNSIVGGGGINVSLCLSKLGKRIEYLGKISEESKKMIYTLLKKNSVGIIDTKISKIPCAKSIILDTKENDRIIYTFRGQNSHFNYSDFDANSFSAKNYYFNCLTDSGFDTQLKLAQTIKSRNPNANLCYNPSSYLIKNETNKLKSLIKYVDILILNFEEAAALTKKDKISTCLKEMKNLGSKISVITDGSRGSYCYDGKTEYHEKSFLIKNIVDTTGAGDCFAGTFFYFYVKGFGIRKALNYASKNSASVISKKGAHLGLLNYDEIIN